MKVEEFKIESLPNLEFRTMKVSPIDLLAIIGQIDLENYEHSKELYKFTLEHIEVKQGEKWFGVKFPDREVYTPTSIEDNLPALMELNREFIERVITPAFQKSSE